MDDVSKKFDDWAINGKAESMDYPEIAVLFEKNFIFNDTISDYFFIAKNGISDRVVIKFNDAILQNTNNQKDIVYA